MALPAVALGIAALTGCTSDPPDDAAPTSVATDDAPTQSAPTQSQSEAGFDACALFPAEELAKIIDLADVETGPGGGWSAGGCTINSPTAGLLIQVGTSESFTANADPALPDPASRLAAYEQELTATGVTPDPLDDVGDGALTHTDGGAAQGNGIYIEIVAPGAPTDQIEQILTLAITTASTS